jgi:hypothetical protein
MKYDPYFRDCLTPAWTVCAVVVVVVVVGTRKMKSWQTDHSTG